MKTYCTFAAVSLALAAATGAMAAPPSAGSQTPVQDARPFTHDTVTVDPTDSRQAARMLLPRDGEWYNVPAPLGGMHRMDHSDHREDRMRHEDSRSPASAPAGARTY